jgi:hypothetical protein
MEFNQIKNIVMDKKILSQSVESAFVGKGDCRCFFEVENQELVSQAVEDILRIHEDHFIRIDSDDLKRISSLPGRKWCCVVESDSSPETLSKAFAECLSAMPIEGVSQMVIMFYDAANGDILSFSGVSEMLDSLDKKFSPTNMIWGVGVVSYLSGQGCGICAYGDCK